MTAERFAAEGRDRFDAGDQMFWDFVVGEVPITLHLRERIGIAVIAGERSVQCEALVRQIAEILARDVAKAPR
jgi:hypothetical protein